MERCSADYRLVDFLPNPGNEALVSVCTNWGTCRVLLFDHVPPDAVPPGGWRLVDYIDVIEQRYGLPEHRIERAGEIRWLVFKMYAGSGTGVYRYLDEWWEIVDSKARPAATVLNVGSDVNRDPGRQFHAEFLERRVEGEDEILLFDFIARFVTFTDFREIWVERRRVSYSRKLGAPRFAFDPARSELTEDELSTVFNFDSLTFDQLIAFCSANLRRIATGPENWQKAWLRDWLPRIPPSPAQQQLQTQLIP